MRRALSLGLCFCLLGAFAQAQTDTMLTPARAAYGIIERVMRETSFELQPETLTPTLGIEVVDFGRLFASSDSVAFARSIIAVDKDTTLLFGLSRDLPASVTINDTLIAAWLDRVPFVFNEIGYEIFRFNDTIGLPLKKGANTILFKARLTGDQNVVYLREMMPPGAKPCARFGSGAGGDAPSGGTWMYLGAFESPSGGARDTLLPPERAWAETYSFQGTTQQWRPAPQTVVWKLRTKPDAAYRREAYAEWQYPTGTLMLSLLDYAAASGDSSAAEFVRRYCAFTLDNLDLFRRQYEQLHAFRGTDHKIFRCGMLDDAGAPTLPFAELLLSAKDPRMDSLVSSMAAYVINKQLRLDDGTFCRDEPARGTVWGDDLFMSTPLMVRMGRLTGERRWFDDAARQIINFNRYLMDTKTGLYRHGWYSLTKCQSPAAWGRANGWIVWATSEVLRFLPESHPLRPQIADIFRAHLRAILRYQAPSGLWHQVLDRPDSFEETSCTAMYIIGMVRGIKMGVVDQRFIEPLKKARTGLLSRISADGRVKDICRGTELSNDVDYYFHRERFENDPRGLGAVVTACSELIDCPW